MDPMTEDQTETVAAPDPRRAVVFLVVFAIAAAGLTIFLARWVPLWVTLPASLVLAMIATRADARRRPIKSKGDPR